MTPTQALRLTCATFPSVGQSREKLSWAFRLQRGIVFSLLFTVPFLQEYFKESAGPFAAIAYAKLGGGFRTIDVVILLAAFVHITALCCSQLRHIRFPRALAVPGLLFLLMVALAVIRGTLQGGENLFFDWRALALGIALYLIWSFWIQTIDDIRAAINIFCVCVAAVLLVLSSRYLMGGGDILQGIRIPVYDGPTLSTFVGAALLGASLRRYIAIRWRFVYLAAAVLSGLMVLLCFRRTYWAQLTMGAVALIWFQSKHRMRALLTLVVCVSLIAVLVGPTFLARLRSFNLTQNTAEFSDDNSDHVDDLLDAWDQVRQHPVFGRGLAAPYPTWRIRNWKSESVMVHNAAIHVWLKYGILALAFYILYHCALFCWLKQCIDSLSGVQRALVTSTLAYLLSQFLISLTFAPWPYSELQLTAFTSFLLVTASARNPNCLNCHP